jgi:hypothetical protein
MWNVINKKKRGDIMSTQLSYDDLKQEMIQELQKYTHGVLATSDGNLVTARQMMLIPNGLTISCLTGNYSRKFKQISANKNVALGRKMIRDF